MDRARNAAFSRLRLDDNNGMKMEDRASNRMRISNPMADEDGFDDNGPRERSLLRRSGGRTNVVVHASFTYAS
jgi:hypothetical protein